MNTQHNEDQRIALGSIGQYQEGVSIQIFGNNARVYFRDIVNLRDTPQYKVQIKCIETFAGATIALDPENKILATETAIRNSTLTLCIGETQYKQAEPLINFATQYQNGVVKEQGGLFDVNWEKTYVEINDISLFGSSEVYFFSISYDRVPR